MGNAKNRREQASKHTFRNEDLGRAMIELRQGSRTSPHRNKKKYSRRDRWEMED
jgi:hypothetical protein